MEFCLPIAALDPAMAGFYIMKGDGSHDRYRAVAIGGSAGGAEALETLLSYLTDDFPLPILVVQHLHPADDGAFSRQLARTVEPEVIEPCDKERIEAGRVYTAPANYHMVVEREGTIGLSIDGKVNFSRPSIDVLFESAANAWGREVTAVILSGASADGTEGMRAVRAAGGRTIAQDPAEARYPLMPQSAIDARVVERVLPAAAIGQLLHALGSREKAAGPRGMNLLPYG